MNSKGFQDSRKESLRQRKVESINAKVLMTDRPTPVEG